MKVIIEIDCETVNQLQNHLSVLKKDMRLRAKNQKLDHKTDPFKPSEFFTDSNCYGDHTATVYED
jgi:environmental stress-induced protein Ves